MNSIPVDQNSPEFMRLMRARSRIYQEASRFQIAQLIVAVAVPVAGAIVGLRYPEGRAYVAALALAATFLDVLWLDRAQRTKLKLAARISELFDCGLLGLPWNDFVAGKKPDAMTIAEAERAWRKGDDKLRDWYKPKELALAPLHLARLICQQSNLWYDSRLRRRVGTALVAIAFGLSASLCVAGLALNLPFADFILTVVTPVAPILTWTAREYYRQRDTADALEAIKASADALWSKAVAGECGPDDCGVRSREFQDAIFTRRAGSPLNVPLVYRLLRNTMEANMQAGAGQMLREIG